MVRSRTDARATTFGRFPVVASERVGEGKARSATVAFAVALLLMFLCSAVAFAQPSTQPPNGVLGWGANSIGQVGDGTTAPTRHPVPVSGMTEAIVVDAGETHTLAVKADGTVRAWGYNEYGRLGDGTKTARSAPVVVSGLTDIVSVAAGSRHSLAVKRDGTVWGWGDDYAGQLGNGGTAGRLADGIDHTYPTPIQVPGLTDVVSVAAGDAHSLALKSDGTVWAWGINGVGQLGDGTNATRTSPVQVANLSAVESVTAGTSHNVAVKSDGTVWAWGYNFNGQIGDGSYGPYANRFRPVRVSDLSGVASVSAGGQHTLALKDDGTVWGWGSNSSGQLGNGSTSNTQSTPDRARNLSDVDSVGAGYDFSFALKGEGSLFSWGLNSAGQLGHEHTNSYSTAQPVDLLPGIEAVSGGGQHAVAYKNDTTPPETSISGGPTGSVSENHASFYFLFDEPGVRAECRLDGSDYKDCGTSVSYDNLAESTHSLEVRAVDGGGNTDATPAVHTWTVDTTNPSTYIAEAPEESSNAEPARFSFTSEDGDTGEGDFFECSMDSETDFARCDSPKEYANLPEGKHVLRVRAVDAAGNTDDTPGMHSWMVDRTPPPAPKIASPSNGDTDNTGNVLVTGTAEPGSAIALFDGAASGAPAGTTQGDRGGSWSVALSNLSEGTHALVAVATDDAGNASPSSATRTVRVDKTAPETAITSGRQGWSNLDAESFSFGSEQEDVTFFECSLDAATFAKCSSPVSYENLDDGSHVFRVRAVDAAGNEDTTPAENRWAVDTGIPTGGVAINGDSTYANAPSVTLSLLADDSESGIGVRSMRFSNDGGAWSEWEDYSPTKKWTLNVSQESHTVSVQYRDAVDNTSAGYSDAIILDTLKPKANAVSPASGTTGVAASTNIRAVFSDDMNASTVAGTTSSIVLKKAGSTKAIPAMVAYAATTRAATLNPSSNLVRGATYTVKITSEAEDKAGNGLDQQPAVSGNQAMTWKFRVK